MLIAEHISLAIGGRPVLRDAALRLSPREVLGLWGPSGVGKSTLARILSGAIAPDSGQVTWNGQPLPRAPGPVQHVPQSPELAVDPRWTVGRILDNGGAADPQVLEALGIRRSWVSRRPAELSGGELARVSLSRFFLPGTRVLICDEITAQLDAIAAQALWRALLPLASARRIGVIVISHDPLLRAALCTRSLELGAIMCGQGSAVRGVVA